MQLEELKEKLPATFLDKEKVNEFAAEMLVGIQKGKKEYPESYTFDPLEEAMLECRDISVYSMIMYFRLKQLKEKLDGLASKRS